jgi:two-component system, OmpR family, KDP operon response regulator KdpE
MKILLVEDDMATMESVRFCLEIYKPEYALATTDRGTEAIQKVKSEAFDCILIDLGLPDMDGLEVLRRIREFSQIPAIIVTARHQKDSISRATELGANKYITKPFDHHDFIASLESIA